MIEPLWADPKTQSTLLEFIRNGNHIRVACRAVGIHPSTYAKWVKWAEYKDRLNPEPPPPELIAFIDQIREAEAALHALPKPDGACVQAGESLTDIPELWPHMTAEERRNLVRLVLVKVEIDLQTGSVGGLIPKPAFAPLFRVLAAEEDGLISVCGWRPRGDSNPRSPP